MVWGLTDRYSRVALVEIEEPCRHEIQFGGMCANCGKDMTQCVQSNSVVTVGIPLMFGLQGYI